MAKNNLTSFEKDEFVKLLKQVGCRTASLEALEKDIAAGAPINEDGTINFLHYTAWLLKESNNGSN